MKSLKELIPDTFRQIGIEKKFMEMSLIHHWEKIVGKEIACHSSPINISSGTISVAVDNPAWSHHLMTIKLDIMNSINRNSPQLRIKDIRFCAGYSNFKTNINDTKEDTQPTREAVPVNLDDDEIQRIQKLCAVLTDDQLRQQAQGLIQRVVAAQKVIKTKSNLRCQKCGRAYIARSCYCTVCSIEENIETRSKIRALLKEVPWLSYKECLQYIACENSQYDQAKQELIKLYERDMVFQQDDRIFAMTLIMLQKGIHPEKVTSDMIEKTLSKARRKNYVFTPRS